MWMHPHLRSLLVQEHQADLRRWAAAARRARQAEAGPPAAVRGVTLRLDRVDDEAALGQLAALSERRLGSGPFVLAEVSGRLVAALPLAGGEPLRDPFVPTAHLLALLDVRAAQIRGADERARRRLRLLPLPRRA